MTRFVIGPDVAIRLAAEGRTPTAQLLAPAALRSQVLSTLHAAVRRGELEERDAQARLRATRRLGIRLLGDRVLQDTAWKLADELGWEGTFDAEYLALTRLQADAFVTLDAGLAAAAATVVAVAPYEDLT